MIGGGFIGCEITASLTMIGVKVTQIVRDPMLFATIECPPLSESLHEIYRANGVDLRLEASDIPDADIVVAGIGVEPNVELARDAGLEVQQRGRRRRAVPHLARRRLRDRRRRRVLRPALRPSPPDRALVDRGVPRDDARQDPRRRAGGPLRHGLVVLLRGVRTQFPLVRRRVRARRHVARGRLLRRPRALPVPAGRGHDRRRRDRPRRRGAGRAQGRDQSRRRGSRIAVTLAGKSIPGGALANSEIEQLSIDTIRTLSMDMVQQANAGHPGTAMALAPLAYLLYGEVMNHNPANSHWSNRDRFILSAGHACVLQYSALHLAGYNLSLEELKRFRQWQSKTPGHPELHHTEGIEVTTGPLGQGFANGVGMGVRGALPRRDVQPARARADRRPPRLRDLLRRRPDGGPLVRVRVDRRDERARQAHLLLRRQPHHDRRDDLDLVHRGSRRALRGARLARAARRGRQRARRAARRDRKRAGRDVAAVDHRLPHAHRVRRAEGGRHREGARLAARRRRGRRGEEGARLGPGQALLHPRRGRRAHEPGRPRQRRRDGVGGPLRAAGRRRSRRTASAGTPLGRAASRRGSCPSGSRATTSRRATPARRRCRRSRTPCRR